MNKILTFAPWVLLLIFAFLYFNEKNRMPVLTEPGKPIDVTAPIESRYKDTEGNEHVVISDGKNIISKTEIKNPERPPNIIDSSAANLQIAATQIKSVTKINYLIRDSLLKARKTIDLLTQRLAFAYSDKFVNIKFTPPIDTTDIGTFSFAYNADLNIVQYQKRSWFLGQKKSYIDISSNDPRTTIRGVKQLTVQQEAPQFGLRLQGSANYNLYTNNLGFGPAARLDLGRFSIQGNYMYYPKVKLWYPAVIGNYDIIRF